MASDTEPLPVRLVPEQAVVASVRIAMVKDRGQGSMAWLGSIADAKGMLGQKGDTSTTPTMIVVHTTACVEAAVLGLAWTLVVRAVARGHAIGAAWRRAEPHGRGGHIEVGPRGLVCAHY